MPSARLYTRYWYMNSFKSWNQYIKEDVDVDTGDEDTILYHISSVPDIEILDPDAYTVYSSTTYPLICASDTVTFLIDSITGGNPNIDYYFLDFGNDTINVPAGTYDIFVQDLQFGCADTLSATCTPQYEIEVESTIEHILCFGDSSGTLSISVDQNTGTAPFTYSWNSGQTALNISNLSAGQYVVTITDANGCNYQNTADLIAPPILSLSA